MDPCSLYVNCYSGLLVSHNLRIVPELLCEEPDSMEPRVLHEWQVMWNVLRQCEVVERLSEGQNDLFLKWHLQLTKFLHVFYLTFSFCSFSFLSQFLPLSFSGSCCYVLSFLFLFLSFSYSFSSFRFVTDFLCFYTLSLLTYLQKLFNNS